MEHLSQEELARMVDSTPEGDEAEHLRTCMACRTELDAFHSQTEALRGLPELLPPQGDWAVLEARLRSDGLLRDRSFVQRLGLAQTPSWMKAAAAVLLFLSGTGFGATLTSPTGPLGRMAAAGGGATFANATNVEDAASVLRMAGENYVSAVARYSELLAQDGGGDVLDDPQGRYATLEYLVRTQQAAVRQAPADAFLNGLLASTIAERDAALRRVSTRKANWF